MNILGLDDLVFGVDDMPGSRRYLLDYGLDEVRFDPATGGTCAALDGTSITIRHASDPSLPPLPPGAHSPCLRETVYGVDSEATLDALQAELSTDRHAMRGADGVLRCMDDGGFAIRLCKTVRRPYTARYLGFVTTNRFENLGPFLRPAGTQDHHTLFMIQRFNDHMVGCNHFTFHLGSASEVLQHG